MTDPDNSVEGDGPAVEAPPLVGVDVEETGANVTVEANDPANDPAPVASQESMPSLAEVRVLCC